MNVFFLSPWEHDFAEYRNPAIQGIYANVTREEAVKRVEEWKSLCENMEDEDITEAPDSKNVGMCVCVCVRARV